MAEEIKRSERAGLLRRWARSKGLLIIVILATAVPVIWLSGFRSSAEPPVDCDVQYSVLVKQAKAELINGNRTAAINSLIAARAKLRDCETPSARDVAPIWPN